MDELGWHWDDEAVFDVYRIRPFLYGLWRSDTDRTAASDGAPSNDPSTTTTTWFLSWSLTTSTILRRCCGDVSIVVWHACGWLSGEMTVVVSRLLRPNTGGLYRWVGNGDIPPFSLSFSSWSWKVLDGCVTWRRRWSRLCWNTRLSSNWTAVVVVVRARWSVK